MMIRVAEQVIGRKSRTIYAAMDVSQELTILSQMHKKMGHAQL